MFAGFVARMEDTRLPKYVMFGELVGGAGCVGGQEKEWMGCFLDDLRGINADQWKVAAQDEGEKWRMTAEQGAERFMAKWIAAEKARAGLRHAVVCSNVTGKTKKRMPKASGLVLVRSPQLIINSHKCRELVSLRAYVVLSFSRVTFVLFRFVSFSSVCFC